MKEGIAMPKCELCGVEVAKEVFENDDGSPICEDCKMRISASPSQPCRSEY